MNLGALLNLLRTAILNDRSDRVGGDNDYLWQDETLVTYINEAQNKFAREALVLRDGSTNEVTRVRLVEGQDSYSLHPAVLAVISAKPEGQQADLTRVGHSLLGAYRAPSDSWTDPQSLTTIPAGAPLAFATDEELVADDSGSLSVVTLRVFPKPSAAMADTYLRLRVVRKPLEQLTVDNLYAIPELPDDHHIEMLDWAAYLALRIVDDDAGAPRRAAEFEARFLANIQKVRRQAMRKMFAPMPWGFGRGGFSWDS